ncbi:MAG: hypothetical protein ACI4SP_01235 [Eubacteriales bacterium]
MVSPIVAGARLFVKKSCGAVGTAIGTVIYAVGEALAGERGARAGDSRFSGAGAQTRDE